MSNPYDVIIIGAGHNGLACAAYLGKAGRRVLVLEAAAAVGGAAITAEFAPGFSASTCAHLCYQLNPKVIAELDLPRNGLRWAGTGLDSIALSANGEHLRIAGNGTQASGAGISAKDAAALVEFDARMKRFAALLNPVFDERPPRLADNDWRDKLSLTRLGWKIRRLGRADMREFLRIAAINIFDVLQETFDSDILKGAIGFDAVLGAHMGPRSPNSVLSYLYRLAGMTAGRSDGVCLPQGGIGSLTRALAAAAQSQGVTIRVNSAVRRITMEHDRVSGVELADGEVLQAGTIVSNADPRTTFFKLLGADRLETGFARYVKNIRMRGCAAKLHLALDHLPAFSGLESPALAQRLLIAPSLSYVEHAFDHVKYGEYSRAPAMEISIPTVQDPALAPPGKHVLSAIVQYVPYALKTGWEADGERFKDLVIDTIAGYAPDLRQCITAAELLTPADIERDFRIGGGHWHHGELAFDQFLMLRPVPGAAQYATPVPGLYLCGAGAHPGGGVMASVGRNAAHAVLSGA